VGLLGGTEHRGTLGEVVDGLKAGNAAMPTSLELAMRRELNASSCSIHRSRLSSDQCRGRVDRRAGVVLVPVTMAKL